MVWKEKRKTNKPAKWPSSEITMRSVSSIGTGVTLELLRGKVVVHLSHSIPYEDNSVPVCGNMYDESPRRWRCSRMITMSFREWARRANIGRGWKKLLGGSNCGEYTWAAIQPIPCCKPSETRCNWPPETENSLRKPGKPNTRTDLSLEAVFTFTGRLTKQS